MKTTPTTERMEGTEKPMAIIKPTLATLDQLPDWANLITRSLLEGLRVRDPYTYGHCRRVGRNARLLAKA
ncbi:MAG: hypothetical protein RJB38_62, partial [Pseudomonadota bacterium]